jgi:biopolymer transport protein TolR
MRRHEHVPRPTTQTASWREPFRIGALHRHDDHSIPQSLSERKPGATVVVMVTKDSLFVDGKPVGTIAALVADAAPVYAPLKAALVAQNSLLLNGAANTDIAKREVTIMGDKNTPYSVMKKIMVTCSQAEYGKVSFAVVERERAAT